jgi:hypothetical protein
MRVFDASGEAEDINVVSADVAREIGKVGQGCDDAHFGGLGGQAGQAEQGSD